MNKITTKFKQELKAKAHALRPIVLIGNNGFTENVKMEIDRGLKDHELIKIRISRVDRDERHELFSQICESVTAIPVQLIGNVGVIYRKNEE
jgi:RNA-binding protein